MKNPNDIVSRIPARYRPWLASLLGGLSLIGLWGFIAQQERKSLLSNESSGGTNATGGMGTPMMGDGSPMMGRGMMVGPYRDGRYEGSSDAPWGAMKIAVTVKNGYWSNIRVLSIPDSPPSYAAVDELVRQALEAQTSEIAGVSGATYTSDAFRDDLTQIIAASTR